MRPTLSRILVDILIVPTGFILGYIVKFKLGFLVQQGLGLPYGRIYEHAQIEPYVATAVPVTLLWLLTLFLARAYRPFSGLMPLIDESITLIKASLIATVELMALTFVFHALPGSRYVIIYAFFFTAAGLVLSRWVLWRWEFRELRSGRGLVDAIVIGATDLGQDVAERLYLYPSFRTRYVGSFDDAPPAVLHFHLRDCFRYLGGPQDVLAFLKDHPVRHIFVTRALGADLSQALIAWALAHHANLQFVPDMAQLYAGPLVATNLDGVPFVGIAPFRHPWLELAVKRLLDIIGATLLILLTAPIWLSAALLIKLSSPHGPILYRQERVGLNGKPFGMYKFRTMIPDAEKDSGPVMVSEASETRYIRGGAWLRQTSIDELPQLLNVLKGDMSLVGPRPERPFFADQFAKAIPFYMDRHRMRGGLTGWAQVNGRSVLTRRPEHKLKYDLYYISNWSLLLDLKILLKTISVVFTKEEAY